MTDRKQCIHVFEITRQKCLVCAGRDEKCREYATATTAASGGNREELLGPRPAGCKRSEADAGSRNPGSFYEKVQGVRRA